MFSGKYPAGTTAGSRSPGVVSATRPVPVVSPHSDGHATRFHLNFSSVTGSLCPFWFLRETWHIETSVKHSLSPFIYIVFVSLWSTCYMLSVKRCVLFPSFTRQRVTRFCVLFSHIHVRRESVGSRWKGWAEDNTECLQSILLLSGRTARVSAFLAGFSCGLSVWNNLPQKKQMVLLPWELCTGLRNTKLLFSDKNWILAVLYVMI